MKITFILPVIDIGGGTRVIFEYANHLRDRGHIVNIIFPLSLIPFREKAVFADYLNVISKAIFYLKNKGKVDWFDLKIRVKAIPTINPKFIKYIEKFIPDADAVFATSWETAYAVERLSSKKGIKYYFVQSYEIWDVWNSDPCWDLARQIEQNPERLCIAMKDVIPHKENLQKSKLKIDNTYKLSLKKITISSWLKELIENKFEENVEGMIINGINLDTFYINNEHNNRKNKNRIRILMPYRPRNKFRGTEDGIRAFKIVREKYPNAEFIMYGSKRGKNIPEWITIHERLLYDDESCKLYNSSHIFVHPSWLEGCQLPPMEAMACGCAVVATNIGGIPDYSIKGETILTSPPMDPLSIAANIIKLIEDDSERKRISENGNKYIKQFTWDRATDQLEMILENNRISDQPG